MKERVYEVTCWQGYINKIKEELNRSLTTQEYYDLMQLYIKAVPVNTAIMKLEKPNEQPACL